MTVRVIVDLNTVVDLNIVVDINNSCRSFAFSQSRTKVSAGLKDLRGRAVEAFDLVYCSLSVLRSVFVLDIRKQSS